jgi:hypothetical protein
LIEEARGRGADVVHDIARHLVDDQQPVRAAIAEDEPPRNRVVRERERLDARSGKRQTG